MRGASEEVWGEVEVGAEDDVVFVPDPTEGCRVLVEGVVDPLLGFGVRVVSVIFDCERGREGIVGLGTYADGAA